MKIVRLARVVFGISQTELSGRSGVSVRALQRIEEGENAPSVRTLKAIDEAFGEILEERKDGASGT